MSYNTDLNISPKFAGYLMNTGMLEALVNALKQFREKENYPFILAQQRIVKQSVFKALCDYYSNAEKKPSLKKLTEETEDIAKQFFGESPRVAQEIFDEVQDKIKKIEKADKKAPAKPVKEIPIDGIKEIPIIEEL